jgi:hypothetical protein
MILPDFVLTTRQNQMWDTSGIDSLEYCISESYFQNYPHEVSYKFNSRGFRDEEWPEDIETLKKCIWCFGDSFTVGTGCPYDSIWVKSLEDQYSNLLSTALNRDINIRTINISMDGASNEWISRKVLRVIEEIDPKLIIIHWSFFDRRENPDLSLSDEDRRTSLLNEEDYKSNKHHKDLHTNLKNTLKCIKKVENSNHSGTIINSVLCDEINFYPYATSRSIHNSIRSLCKNYITFQEKVDIARDGFHYGINANYILASKILEKIIQVRVN